MAEKTMAQQQEKTEMADLQPPHETETHTTVEIKNTPRRLLRTTPRVSKCAVSKCVQEHCAFFAPRLGCLVLTFGALWVYTMITDNTRQPARTPTRPVSWDDESHSHLSGAGIYDIHKKIQTVLNPALMKRGRGGTPTITGNEVRQLNGTEIGFAVPMLDPRSNTTLVSNVTAKIVLLTDADVEAVGGVVPTAVDPDTEQDEEEQQEDNQDEKNPQEEAFAYNFQAWAGVPGVGSELVSSGVLSCRSPAEEAAPEVQEPGTTTPTTTAVAASCEVEKEEFENGQQDLVQSPPGGGSGPPRHLFWKMVLVKTCMWVKYCEKSCTSWFCRLVGRCRSICIQVFVWAWRWVESCFPPDALVTTFGGKQVPIAEINVGDSVLTPRGFEPVYFLTHADDNTPTPYVELTLSTGGTPVRLSPGHYLPVDGEYRLARNVRAGMSVQLQGSGKEATVDRITMVVKRGAFNPLVMSGEIIVDNVVMSVWSDFLVEGLIREAWAPLFYQNLFAPLRGVYWLTGPDLVRRFCQEYRNTGALSHLSAYGTLATLTKLLLSAEEDVEQPRQEQRQQQHSAMKKSENKTEDECRPFNPLVMPGKIIVDSVVMSYP